MSKKENLIYHRKDGLWEARYVKEIDACGKKKYGSVYGHSCKEVTEKRHDIIDNIRLFQRLPTIRNMTVTELAIEWLYINQNRIKLSTYQRYSSVFKKHIVPIIGKKPIIYLTPTAIHEFALNRLSAGLQPQTVNSILIFLHSCLKYGHRQYNLPLPDIIYLTVQKKEMRVLSFEEQQKLVDFLNKDLDIYKFGVLLALYTGIRIGELCSLKWSDISECSIKIRRTIQRLQNTEGNKTELHFDAPKTSTSMREIPIPSFLKEIIEHFRKSSSQEFILGTVQMPIVEPRVMQIKFKKYLETAGIEKANFHSLRHTFATRCVECGFEIKSLSEILGHSNVTITLARYVHSSFELKSNNMEKLRQIL